MTKKGSDQVSNTLNTPSFYTLSETVLLSISSNTVSQNEGARESFEECNKSARRLLLLRPSQKVLLVPTHQTSDLVSSRSELSR